ncbi:MAG: MBL fold metallo-hydrolase [Thiothrix sp.]|nr:MAG: MBL fold metallo-hydrolase [Thiothrix sp.]
MAPSLVSPTKPAVFAKGKFHNQQAQQSKSLWEYLKMTRKHPFSQWPAWVENEYTAQPIERVNDGSLQVTVIGHSTVLIQTAGYNILTDPVYGMRASPVNFAGPKRVRAPAIRFEDLPPIDVVAISHDHYDHLDSSTVQALVKRDNPAIFVGLGVAKRMPYSERVTELDWWEASRVSDQFNVYFVPTQHFSGRGLFDRDTTLWGGFVLEVSGRKVYFGGDTGYADHFQQTYAQFGAMDIALIPIGAYEPREFMGPVHMDPQEAVQAHLDLHAKRSIGVHYATFQMTSEPIHEPVKLLEAARAKAGLSAEDFMALPFGQTLIVDD